MIAVVGGFTASNYGDQLYPSVFEGLLHESGIDEEVKFFSPIPGRMEDGRYVGPVTSLQDERPRAVLVGGGDLIRTDTENVAQDHLNTSFARRRKSAARLRARFYARRHFGTEAGPWLPGHRWTADHVPVIWVSVGVHPLPDRPDVHAAVRQVSAAWIRTSNGIERACAAGLGDDHALLGPDAIFAIARLADPRWRDLGSSILKRATGAESDKVVVIHAAPFTGWNADRLSSTFSAIADLPAVLLPMGRYVREDKELMKAAGQLGRVSLGVLTVEETTGVLSVAGSVVTTSMHAAIVASSFGRPVVVPGTEKTLEAFEACPEPPFVANAEPAEVVETLRGVHGGPDADVPTSNADAVLDALRWALGHAGVL